jgi:hypothetical protein
MSPRRATVAVIVLACSSCVEPTEVTLLVRTDLPCSDVGETALFVGPPGGLDSTPATATNQCSASGTLNVIGTFAVVPENGATEVAARVVLATKGLSALRDCTESKNWAGCIVSRRKVSFLPRHSLTVPIDMLLVCEGIGCDDNTTCTSIGLCGSTQVDSSACQGDVCSQTLPPAVGVDGGVAVPASAQLSTFVAMPSAAPADGVTPSTLTLTLRDALGNPIAGKEVSMNVSGSSNAWEAAANATDATGVLVAQLRSTVAEPKIVTASVLGIELRTTVTFVRSDGGFTNTDAGSDAGSGDAGPDAGSRDAGPDAGSRDAGADAGQTTDGGAVDAGIIGATTAVVVGWYWGCALIADGGVRCWGAGGNVGDGTLEDRPLATQIDLPPVAALSTGYDHTCALAIDGGVWCWGFNEEGQLGVGPVSGAPVTSPVFVTGLEPVQQIALGDLWTCALTLGGAVKCWGEDWTGSLVTDGGYAILSPTVVPGLESGCALIAAGDTSACALMVDGGVRCWGDTGFGDLGNGNSDAGSSTAVDVIGLHGPAIQVSVGYSFACVLLASGEVQCWGSNSEGELGLGFVGGQSAVPVTLVGIDAGVVGIFAGGDGACLTTAQGGVQCWNAVALDLGDGSDAGRPYPGDVLGLPGPVIGMSAPLAGTCVVLDGGAVMCWGENFSGGLGDGTYVDRVFPVFVRMAP